WDGRAHLLDDVPYPLGPEHPCRRREPACRRHSRDLRTATTLRLRPRERRPRRIGRLLPRAVANIPLFGAYERGQGLHSPGGRDPRPLEPARRPPRLPAVRTLRCPAAPPTVRQSRSALPSFRNSTLCGFDPGFDRGGRQTDTAGRCRRALSARIEVTRCAPSWSTVQAGGSSCG